ncbi:TetR family transcriptional regulator C-terminal domain-containing protein [Paenibacillus sp. N4]|uniref:TetR/AcrR family transcriptional regulator n=1 Tax=Paenibacillus vietnamensis TaxID=2590547 RepID=UPI001CD17F59|nr:TetR-like C-terminal domain-containing protein [Paenibacillus vietnamensis]MCA0757727.1 TetR family transcriptional regulator C-terminal domain-containing protein [Paenibacillus vietnamensis]
MNHDKPRTDPRILRTRQLLKDAFIDLLQEMEIEKISVNRISERATINRVTFYLHYRDIPDMMDKMADEMIEDIKNALTRKPIHQNSVEETFSWDIVSLLEHIAEHAKFYKVILGSRRTPVFTDRLLKMLSESVKYRLENDQAYILNAGIQKDIAIWYGASALIGTIVSWVRNDMPYTPQFLAKQLTLMLSKHHD